jgi:hypothetical protein
LPATLQHAANEVVIDPELLALHQREIIADAFDAGFEHRGRDAWKIFHYVQEPVRAGYPAE